LAACESWVKNGLIANLVTIAIEREPTQLVLPLRL